MGTVSVEIDAPVKDVIAELESALERKGERARALGGPDFESHRQRRSTPGGFVTEIEHSGTIGGRDAFVRAAIAYDRASDSASVQVSETIPTAAAAVTGTLAPGRRGGTRVVLKTTAPRGMAPLYRSYVAGVMASAKRRAERAHGVARSL